MLSCFSSLSLFSPVYVQACVNTIKMRVWALRAEQHNVSRKSKFYTRLVNNEEKDV